MSEPALAKASMKGSQGAIIRCTSKSLLECGRSAFTTSGPIVRFGTKWPSNTSTRSTSHHAGPDRDVAHEVAVHDIHMDPVAAGAVDRLHLLAQLGEIGREDRRRDDD